MKNPEQDDADWAVTLIILAIALLGSFVWLLLTFVPFDF